LISEVPNTPDVPKVAADSRPRARPAPPRVPAAVTAILL
jgi:hypothetical protein